MYTTTILLQAIAATVAVVAQGTGSNSGSTSPTPTGSTGSTSPVAPESSSSSTSSTITGYPSSIDRHDILPGRPCNPIASYHCAFDGRCSQTEKICGGFNQRCGSNAQCAANSCVNGRCTGPLPTKGSVPLGEVCSLGQDGRCVDGAVCYSPDITENPKCIKSTTQSGSIIVGQPCNPNDNYPCAYGASCSVSAKICGAFQARCNNNAQCASNTCVDFACTGSITKGSIPVGEFCSAAQTGQCVAGSDCYSPIYFKTPTCVGSNTPGSNVTTPPINPNRPTDPTPVPGNISTPVNPNVPPTTPGSVVPGSNPNDPVNPGVGGVGGVLNPSPGGTPNQDGGLYPNSTIPNPSRSIRYSTSVAVINGVTTSVVVEAGATTTPGSGPSASPTESAGGIQSDGTGIDARLGTTLLFVLSVLFFVF